MPTDEKTITPAAGFQPGHPRWGGRKRNTAKQARALAHELGVDPLEFCLRIIQSDTIQQTVMENGKKKRVTMTIPLEMRLDAAKHVSRFLYPTLSAQSITGADDGPVEVAAIDINKIMENPVLVAAAQELALAGIAARKAGAPQPLLPSAFTSNRLDEK